MLRWVRLVLRRMVARLEFLDDLLHSKVLSSTARVTLTDVSEAFSRHGSSLALHQAESSRGRRRRNGIPEEDGRC